MTPENENLFSEIMRMSALSHSRSFKEGLCTHLVESLDDKVWSEVFPFLKLNRTLPLAANVLLQPENSKFIPTFIREKFIEVQSETLKLNHLFSDALIDILAKLDRMKIKPSVWKGMVLAYYYYPDFGSRAMFDVDLGIQPEERELVQSVFLSAGYQILTREGDTGGATNYIKDSNIEFDVHHRVRFFEGFEPSLLYVEMTVPGQDNAKFKSFAPNALIALLVEHAGGHIESDGFKLKYLYDLLFALRSHHGKIKVFELRKFLKNEQQWSFIMRSAGFFRSMDITKEFEFLNEIEAARDVTPYTVPEILRNNRLRAWRLPNNLRSYGRLFLSLLGVMPKRFDSFPRFYDFLMIPFDVWIKRRTLAQVRKILLEL